MICIQPALVREAGGRNFHQLALQVDISSSATANDMVTTPMSSPVTRDAENQNFLQYCDAVCRQGPDLLIVGYDQRSGRTHVYSLIELILMLWLVTDYFSEAPL
jgi:hypothetical protein